MALSANRTVLMVNDEPAFAETVASQLTNEGFTVWTVADVPAALAELARSRPDVVLSDVWLPEASGWDLAERLIDRGDHIPLVLMSGTTVPAPVGAVRFVGRDEGLDRILATLQEALAPPLAEQC